MKAIVVHPGHGWSTADVYTGWVEAFNDIGVDTRTFNLNDRLLVYTAAHRPDDTTADGFSRIWDETDVGALIGHDLHGACFQFQPDFVFVISARFLPAWVYDMIRDRGIRVVILHTESPYEDEQQLFMAAHADLNLINDPTNLDRFEALSPAAYAAHAYRPTVHCPGPSNWDVDFSWVGTAGNTFPSRTRFFEQVDFRDYRVALGGLWDGVDPDHKLYRHLAHPGCSGVDAMLDNTETVDLYRGSKISANLYRQPGDNTDDRFKIAWAMGPREVELAATGTFFARHSPGYHGGEGDQVLSMLPTFTEPDELSEIIAHYIDRPDARQRIVDQARRAIADRSFQTHARRLLEHLPHI